VTRAVVVVATGVDAPAQHESLAELADATGATLAYLQQGSPTLVDELDRLASAGVREVALVRAPTAGRSPDRSWLRRVAGHWCRDHPDVRVVVGGTEVTGREAPLRSSAWEQVPGHHRQVLVCRGPRCSARGAARTSEAVDAALRRLGLGDDDVLVTQTGCLFPCNHAPVVVVHPDDAWFGGVDEEAASGLVADIAAGRPPAAHRLPRRPAGDR
jgi:(2Fe-2S) ferredoxin